MSGEKSQAAGESYANAAWRRQTFGQTPAVVELRKEYGLGFNVWFQPVGGDYADELGRIRYNNQWSVPSQAMEVICYSSIGRGRKVASGTCSECRPPLSSCGLVGRQAKI